MIIRKYKESDREEVEKIHFETGFLGRSMETILDDRKFWSSMIRYYLEKEPESIFIAEENKKIIGYLFGCLDDKKENSVVQYLSVILGKICIFPFLSRKNKIFIKGQMIMIFDYLAGRMEDLKLKVPDNSGHLHINFLPQARGKGHGSELLKEFIKYCKKNSVNTIHADSFETEINPNSKFWMKNGFKIYSRVKSSYWKGILPNEKIDTVCYVKEIK